MATTDDGLWRKSPNQGDQDEAPRRDGSNRDARATMPLTRQRDRDWLALLAARRDLRFAALCEFIMWHHGAPETLTPTRIVEIAKKLIEIWHDDDTGGAVAIDVHTPYGSLLPLLDELAAIDNAIEEIE